MAQQKEKNMKCRKKCRRQLRLSKESHRCRQLSPLDCRCSVCCVHSQGVFTGRHQRLTTTHLSIQQVLPGSNNPTSCVPISTHWLPVSGSRLLLKKHLGGDDGSNSGENKRQLVAPSPCHTWTENARLPQKNFESESPYATPEAWRLEQHKKRRWVDDENIKVDSNICIKSWVAYD